MKTMISLMTRTLAAGAVLLSGAALAGIANTPHNLGTTGTGPNHLTSGTADLCVFCHTPHGAETGIVALWNRKMPTGPYTTYNSLGSSSTMDGQTTSVGSVSIACLSCHDGTQAMNTVLNAPGSGGYNPAGASMGGTWTGPRVDPATGKMTVAGNIANLGTDLSNDHPIGVQYGGGGQDTANPSGAFKDPDFKPTKTELIGGNRVWWVDSGTAPGVRDKKDMLLYTRTDPAIGPNPQPFVECASCHDPHSESPGAGEVHFLRISNAGSAVCLACHTK